ncbi:MAG TPA: ethanolamine transporter, partial [Acinetobacter radioresistens]|nr:ethanolamine transporter [Acinetobacter radioresistens]
MNNPKIVDATASSTLRTQEEYFAKRQLKQGAVGWLLLV